MRACRMGLKARDQALLASRVRVTADAAFTREQHLAGQLGNEIRVAIRREMEPTDAVMGEEALALLGYLHRSRDVRAGIHGFEGRNRADKTTREELLELVRHALVSGILVPVSEESLEAWGLGV